MVWVASGDVEVRVMDVGSSTWALVNMRVGAVGGGVSWASLYSEWVARVLRWLVSPCPYHRLVSGWCRYVRSAVDLHGQIL